MALRAFTATFRCAIDVEEAVENEQRDEDAQPVTLDEVAQYLKDALRLDLNVEENGNAVGMQSVEVNFGTLKELTPEEVQRDYGPKQPEIDTSIRFVRQCPVCGFEDCNLHHRNT